MGDTRVCCVNAKVFKQGFTSFDWCNACGISDVLHGSCGEAEEVWQDFLCIFWLNMYSYITIAMA